MKAVASLNSGSSSIKFALFAIEAEQRLHLVATGKIEKIGIAPTLRTRSSDGAILLERDWPNGASLHHQDLLADLFAWADAHPLEQREIVAIGHRIVHGGRTHAAPRIVDAALLDDLEALCPLAPLHQPHNLAAIRAIRDLRPTLTQVACFDTAFHHEMHPLAARLALPRALHDQGIRRYGFHGLSYEYIARRLTEIDPDLAKGRVIAAHLGNGASLCAMKAGCSIDTSMGFTALDGLMMGTRCGTLDPGVVLHLQTQMGMSAAEVEDLLYNRSGLLGVSGLSSDMRTLSISQAPEAEEAMTLYAWRAAREAGALVSALGGLDGIVFTAGIGENDASMRARICKRLEWLGVTIDEEANSKSGPRINGANSSVKVYVIPTDEEVMIARHSLDLVADQVQ